MFDFLIPIFVVGIITLGLYKFFELLICRRERLVIIEKLEHGRLIDYLKLVPMGLRIGAPVRVADEETPRISSGTLRTGCLLLGLGLGLLLGFMLIDVVHVDSYDTRTIIYGGSLLLFGGLGLIAAFIAERILFRRK